MSFFFVCYPNLGYQTLRILNAILKNAETSFFVAISYFNFIGVPVLYQPFLGHWRGYECSSFRAILHFYTSCKYFFNGYLAWSLTKYIHNVMLLRTTLDIQNIRVIN